MEIRSDERLFWFLKKGTILDLSDPPILEMVLQQVLTSGSANDVKTLWQKTNPSYFKQTFQKIKPFLSFEVQTFWEDSLGSD